MSAPAAATTSPTSTYGPAFWERLWRQSGIGAVVFFLIAYVLYGYAPLIAAVFAGMAILNLLWFAAALRTTLADAGLDGWGGAATASSAALGGLLFLLVAVGATPALNDFLWPCVVLSSFPRAMLIMSGTFGFWRAGLISNALFAAGVAAVVLVVLGGTTWLSGGFWAPDGAYSRFISPLICLAWVALVSAFLTRRNPTRAGW